MEGIRNFGVPAAAWSFPARAPCQEVTGLRCRVRGLRFWLQGLGLGLGRLCFARFVPWGVCVLRALGLGALEIRLGLQLIARAPRTFLRSDSEADDQPQKGTSPKSPDEEPNDQPFS